MKKVAVIGGGFAGLSAAVRLAENGFKVHLFEASPKLGGRAYSFFSEKYQAYLDNGQHILMGCYRETLDFITTIGAKDRITIQKNLEVPFITETGEVHTLTPPGDRVIPRMVRLGTALFRYESLSFSERFSIAKLFLKIKNPKFMIPEHLNAATWLQQEGINENSIKRFFEILGISALNATLKESSASVFKRVLREIFFGIEGSERIIIPSVGLSQMYCEPAVSYLKERSNQVDLSKSLDAIFHDGTVVKKLIIGEDEYNDFDAVILAVPPYALSRIRGGEFLIDPVQQTYTYAPIISAHLFLGKNYLEKPFYALHKSPIHWVFNHGNRLTLVISAAYDIVEKSNEYLYAIIIRELSNYLDISAQDILDYQIIKEKRATVVPAVENIFKRPGTITGIKNLFLAGDWTDTGIPSTIESAVISGNRAAESATKYLVSELY